MTHRSGHKGPKLEGGRWIYCAACDAKLRYRTDLGPVVFENGWHRQRGADPPSSPQYPQPGVIVFSAPSHPHVDDEGRPLVVEFPGATEQVCHRCGARQRLG